MSEIYEGIICRAKKEEVAKFLTDNRDGQLNLREVADEILLILLNENSVRSFSSNTEAIAQEISIEFQESLLFQYDSRVGHRISRLFVNGELKKKFDIHDELYLILDEDGEPDKNRELIPYSEMLEEEEYETSKNAIDLGLEQIYSNLRWKELKEFLNTT